MGENELVPEATRRIHAYLDELRTQFSVSEIRAMVVADDFSPIYQKIDFVYAMIAETALALFLYDLNRAASAIPGLVIDTTDWRIIEEQARLREYISRVMAEDQKNVIRDVIQANRGESARLVAVRIRNALGLTRPMYDRVHAYERTAAIPSRSEVEKKDLVSPEQLAVMTAAFAAGILKSRAEVLGLLEAQRARGRADLEAYRQAVVLGMVDGSRVVRVWNILGINTRDSHSAMRGQERGLNEPFTSGLGNSLMYPGDGAAPPQDIVNCNCWVTYKYARKV